MLSGWRDHAATSRRPARSRPLESTPRAQDPTMTGLMPTPLTPTSAANPPGSALRRLLAGGFLGGTDRQFERFGQAFRRGMRPADLLEALHVDLALIALSQLRRAVV